MGLLTAMNASINGINSVEDAFSVVGNNIANLNTAGFKNSGVLFSEVFHSEMSKVGSGNELHASLTDFSQGAIVGSDNALDFAIEGKGFFIVDDPVRGNEYYTRAGTFLMDKDAFVVNPDGLRLQGYMANASGVIGSTVGDIQIPRDSNGDFTMAADATSAASLRVNLNAADPALTWTFTPGLNPPADGSYNFSSLMNIYDAEGNIHTVDAYFVKTGFDPVSGLHSWEAHAIYNSMKTGDSYQEAGSISLTFDTGGNLTSAGSGNLNFVWAADDWDGDPATAATTPAAQTVSFDLTDSTQYASADTTMLVKTDGYAVGHLAGFNVDSKGVISGTYSNGYTMEIAQLALATFRAPTELQRKGDNLYAATEFSGPKTEAAPGSGASGTVLGASLEVSNVDLAAEFARMITLQKAFQASSTVMKTQIEMLERMDSL